MNKEILIGLALISTSLQAADSTLGTYMFTYNIGASTYTDTFYIKSKGQAGDYFGVDDYGSPVSATKQGSQLCIWEEEPYITAETWCTPIAKTTKYAFHSMSFVSRPEPGTDNYWYYSFVDKATAKKTTKALTYRAAIASTLTDYDKSTKVLNKIESAKSNPNHKLVPIQAP